MIYLVFVGGFVAVKGDSSKIWPLTNEHCVQAIQGMDSVDGFLHFSSNFVPKNDDLMGEQQKTVINTCLQSVDGQADIKALQELIQQASQNHSVCEPEFTEKLLEYDKQIRDNASLGGYLSLKQEHRLMPIFRLFVGQVILTCKKSLTKKIQLAENNSDVARAIERISGLLRKNKEPIDSGKARNLSTVMRILISLAMKYTPSVVTEIEKLVLFDSLKPQRDAVFSIGVIVNSENTFKEFEETQKACKLIDEYAQSSIYAIAILAWKGYLARNDSESIEGNLNDDERVRKWIKVVQYCQSILIVEAKLDLEQESLLKLNKDSFSNSEQTIALDVSRKERGQTSRQVHRYEQVDNFSEFDADLRCYTFADGLKGWLLKRLGVGGRLIAKYIRISVLDESSKQLMHSDLEHPKNGVLLVGASAAALRQVDERATNSGWGA